MTNRLLKLPEVMNITGLSRSSIYAFMSKNEFPKTIPLGARAVGWLSSEINEWVEQRTEQRGV